MCSNVVYFCTLHTCTCIVRICMFISFTYTLSPLSLSLFPSLSLSLSHTHTHTHTHAHTHTQHYMYVYYASNFLYHRFRQQVSQLYDAALSHREWSSSVSNSLSLKIRRDFLLQDALEQLQQVCVCVCVCGWVSVRIGD